MSGRPEQDDEIDNIGRALNSQLGSIASSYGFQLTRGHRKKGELRFGTNGSLSIVTDGPKMGAWFDHELGVGGYGFKFLQYAESCSFSHAVNLGRSWTGLQVPPLPSRAAGKGGAVAPLSQESRIAVARVNAGQSVPVGGTLGEQYLVRDRKIPAPLEWPNAVRFHPPSRSLLLVATDAHGSCQAVQRVHLDNWGHKIRHEQKGREKTTNGVLAGAAVRLGACHDVPTCFASILLLAEGPETGVSIWAATRAETWIVFGGGVLKHLAVPTDRPVILCRDDDRIYSPADKALKKAVMQMRMDRVSLVVATPWSVPRHDKSDFNDVLKAGGVKAVAQRIGEQILTPQSEGLSLVPIEVARQRVADVVSNFFSRF